MHHLHFHFPPLLVCAVILWLLGALWYSPLLFAKLWAAMVGRPMGQKPTGVVHGMIASFIGDLLIALVMAHIVYWSGGMGFGWGAFIGFLAWVGFVVAPLYPQRIYEGRPFAYFAINAGYWLIGLVIVGGVLATWR